MAACEGAGDGAGPSGYSSQPATVFADRGTGVCSVTGQRSRVLSGREHPGQSGTRLRVSLGLGAIHRRMTSVQGVWLLVVTLALWSAAASGSSLSETDVAHINAFRKLVEDAAVEKTASTPLGSIQKFSLGAGTLSAAARVTVAVLETQGFTLNEFVIPPGSTVSTDANTVLLVYSSVEGSLQSSASKTGKPLAPYVMLETVGVLANGTVVDAEVTLPLAAPLTITFTPTEGIMPTCISVNETGGSETISQRVGDSAVDLVCLGLTLGGFSVVDPPKALAPGPGPVQAPVDNIPPSIAPQPDIVVSGRSNGHTGVVVGATVGTVIGLAFLACLLLLGRRVWRSQNIKAMTAAAERGETLQTALMAGGSRAPAAGATRTKPRIETSILEDQHYNPPLVNTSNTQNRG